MGEFEQERRQNVDADTYFNALFEAAPIVVRPGECAFSENSSEMLVATIGAGVVVSL